MVRMRLTALAAIALCAACGSSTMNYPPPTGGGTDGGSSPDAPNPPDGGVLPDAPGADAGSAGTLTGRVCLANDPRDLRACAATGAGGLRVALGDATALTADDGSFTIAGMFASGMEWHVTGANIVTSIMELPDYQIPAITTATYTAMLANNNAALQPGQGTLMVTLVQNGISPVGATAALDPPGFYAPFYDAASTTVWDQGTAGVGSGGTVWLPGVDVGSVTLTATPMGSTMKFATPTQPIADHAITYYVLAFP